MEVNVLVGVVRVAVAAVAVAVAVAVAMVAAARPALALHDVQLELRGGAAEVRQPGRGLNCQVDVVFQLDGDAYDLVELIFDEPLEALRTEVCVYGEVCTGKVAP